jgi:hypothetical protein
VRSTPFPALAGLAAPAVRVSPVVYSEIPPSTPESPAGVQTLAAAVERLLATVRDRRPEEFAGLMDEGRQRTRPERPG